MKNTLLVDLREGKELNFRKQLMLIIQLSIPAILAQISHIMMSYIDASMVGRLGAADSAAIGLVASSTWLLGSLCIAVSTGFTVQVAHFIGAGDELSARRIVKQGLLIGLGISLVLLAFTVSISGFWPRWLGGEEDICHNASLYFLVYGLSLPIIQCNNMAAGMLQCSGNMKLPSILQIVMCFLDVFWNAILIFPMHTVHMGSLEIIIPGAGLGVVGAALGTLVAEVMTSTTMVCYLLFRSDALHLRKCEPLVFVKSDLKKAVKMAIPVGVEQVVMCGAQIMSTKIVAPLGSIAIAANSFAVTAESLCYMPGYGIGSAATTLIGQSIGAGRKKLAKRLGWITTFFGTAIMALSGIAMYIFAPTMIGVLSPDPAIRELGTAVLRIEAFAEPLYGASIIATGVFRGAGDTLVPCVLNFISMWFVRLPMAAVLSCSMGLRGVWIAMCTELCVRGLLFLAKMVKNQNKI